MTMDLVKVPVEATAEPADAAQSPAAVIPEHDPRPLDWGHAVDAAAARLDESWVRPDTTGHMVALGVADEFAAMLCAYGMVAAEVDHMRAMDDEPVAGGQIARK